MIRQIDQFDFDSNAVAESYDELLVPALFRPWAERLIAEHGPWDGQRVLDLATGTGAVARLLAERIGDGEGHVIAADRSPDMLKVAARRCRTANGHVTVRESAAHPLDVETDSMDTIVCQQGFQFFPDPQAAAAEMHRALRCDGRAIVSCWSGVDQCEYFGAICDALVSAGLTDIAQLMERPFLQDGPELRRHFEAAGFENVTLEEQDMPLEFDSLNTAIDTAYATPIGPKLSALPDAMQARFRSALAERLETLSDGGRSMGVMVTHVVTARKAAERQAA